MTKKRDNLKVAKIFTVNFSKLGQGPEFEISLQFILIHSYDFGAFFVLYEYIWNVCPNSVTLSQI